jgi:hypothetical protein
VPEREHGNGWHRRFKLFSFAPIEAGSVSQIATGSAADLGRRATVDMGPLVERHNGLARRLVGA